MEFRYWPADTPRMSGLSSGCDGYILRPLTLSSDLASFVEGNGLLILSDSFWRGLFGLRDLINKGKLSL